MRPSRPFWNSGWLDPDLDAIDNIELLGTVMGLSLRELRAARDEILAFAGLERFANLELRHTRAGWEPGWPTRWRSGRYARC